MTRYVDIYGQIYNMDSPAEIEKARAAMKKAKLNGAPIWHSLKPLAQIRKEKGDDAAEIRVGSVLSLY